MNKTITYLILIVLCIIMFFFVKDKATFFGFGAEHSMSEVNGEGVIALESMTLYKGEAGEKFGTLNKANFMETFGQPDSIATSFVEMLNDTVTTYYYNDCSLGFLENQLVSLYFKDDTFRFNLGVKGVDFYAGGTSEGLYKHFSSAWSNESKNLFGMYISFKGVMSDAYIVFSLKNDLDHHGNVIEDIVFQ